MSTRRSFFRGLIAATALAASSTLGLKVTAKAVVERAPVINPLYVTAELEAQQTFHQCAKPRYDFVDGQWVQRPYYVPEAEGS